MKKAYFLNIISGLLFATSGIFVHFLKVYGFTSMHMTAMRAVVSAIIMAIGVWFYDKTKFKTKPKELFLFVLSGLTMFLTAYFYYFSMNKTTVSTAVVLMYTAPIFVMIFSVIFFKEKFTRNKFISLVLMVAGTVLISGIIGGMKFNALGIITGLLSGLTYSVYNIIIKLEMRRQNHPVTAMLYCYISMGVISILCTDVFEIMNLSVQKPLFIIPLMVGIGIFTCILPYFLYTLSMRKLEAGTASALGLIDPMAATVYGVLLLGEPLEIMSVCGIIMVLVAAFILGREE